MNIFTDMKGRRWCLDLTVGRVKAVQRETGLDLLDPSPEVWQVLSTDTMRVWQVILTVIAPQLEANGVTVEDLEDATSADAAYAAAEALTQAMVDFSPPPRRKALAAAKAAIDRAGLAAEKAAIARIDAMPVEKLAEEAVLSA